MQRIGVMGGTFDPIHNGHLASAQEALEYLALQTVLFVPAPRPPHKLGQRLTDVDHRVAMVKLAIADNPAFQFCDIELLRAGPSYTVDTLKELHNTLGESSALFYIVGSDALQELLTWRDPSGILELATLVVVARPGHAQVNLDVLSRALPGVDQRVVTIDGLNCDIAATDLRTRVHQGKSLRYLTPLSVAAYVEGHGLYGAGSTT
jgi:nicotinate-nucleotide adenylyltransferase